MTKRESLNLIYKLYNLTNESELLTAEEFDAINTYLIHEAELLDRKSSVSSKAKAEADARAEKLYAALAEMQEPVTLSELARMTTDPEVAEYSNQRMSALVRKLGNRVVKTTDKKRGSLFAIA